MKATAIRENIKENRVLVLMPTGRDASLVCSSLKSVGIFAEEVHDWQDLTAKQAVGAGALLIADEALNDETLERLVRTLDSQPIWSDLPVIVFAGSGLKAENLLERIGARFNATIVERPIRIALLISGVRSALRARDRQYQTRDLLTQLEESDRQKDLFLATLSHELRTPLNSILGWLKILRSSNSSAVDNLHALEVIERNARTQSELISDILFVSRIITGKMKLDLSVIDLASVINDAIEVVRPSLEAKRISLETDFDEAGKIKGDAERLQQVFWNILSNAVKFTPDDGTIEVRARRGAAQVTVEISDSGQGIEPEFLPFVFERFRQADNTYTRKVGGLGLGLAIVRYITELHGGSITAKSEGFGRGATFVVNIPICPSIRAENVKPFFTTKAEGGSPANEENLRFPKKIRALIVEDNDDSREMLQAVLEDAGISATAVESAAQAYEIICRNPPDILLSDIGMPDEDGYDLIRKIRQLPPENGGQIPAIALTGYASRQDFERTLQAGFQEHLPKPLDFDKLFETIKRLCLNA